MTTHQQFFKARESRHRHTLESNYNRIMWWSLLEISVIVTVGVIQVSRPNTYTINGLVYVSVIMYLHKCYYFAPFNCAT